jgi:hypothetical protein
MRKIGRIKGGAPAVYVGYGYGLSVSSIDNGLIAGDWLGEDETASKMPLPLQSECDGAHAALFKMQSIVLARDACAASRQEILEMYEGTKSEIDAINAHLKSFGAPDSDAYAKTLHLHGAYIQMRGLLLELAEMSQPADNSHGDLTDLQKLHARINRALAETKDL